MRLRSSGLCTKLTLLASGAAIGAVALEVLARMVMPAPLPWNYPQLRYRPDPLLFFALRPNQPAFTADKPVLINERGLRGAVFPYQRSKDRKRLLFLGDSIVFGFGVGDAQAVTARLAAHLEETGVPVEVINTGVPGYSTEQEVRYLESEGFRYAPDWVIVGLCWNDLADKSEARVSPDGWLISSRSKSQPPAPQESDFAAAYRLRNLLKRSRLLYASLEGWRALGANGQRDRLSQQRSDVVEGRQTPELAHGWELQASAIDRLQRLSQRYGFRLLLVAFPLSLSLQRSFPQSSYPARLQELAERKGILIIDLHEAFRREYKGHESLFIPYDGDHPNAAGHDLAARETARFLAAEIGAQSAPRMQSAGRPEQRSS